jgi:RNA recognition motif-containing protein
VKARNGRSKGFGFIEFANEEDQRAALAAAEKFIIGERNLIVKIALTENRPVSEEADPNAQPPSDTSDAAQKDSNVQQKANEVQA